MKKTLYKDIKECNIKLIIIIGILFIMFSGYTSYSIFTDEVVSNNVITVKVGRKPNYLYKAIESKVKTANISYKYINGANQTIDGIAYNTNDNGVFLYDGTDDNNGTYPIYYYRGNVTNNNVLFANMCWKIVRTTSTGGTKLIYNGIPSDDGKCNNTGEDSSIGTSAFNSSSYASPAYAGYMYGTAYSAEAYSMREIYIYGNDVIYSDGLYTLKDTITQTGDDFTGQTVTDGYYYTCLSNSIVCDQVYYMAWYYIDGDNEVYLLTFKDGDTLDTAKEKMYTNTTDSTIKTTIDNWYSANLTSYTKYLENTIFCNDRSSAGNSDFLINGGPLASKDASMGIDSYFKSYENTEKGTPSLQCTNQNDRFSLSTSNGGTEGYGNNALTYPVGLLTLDEANLAGGTTDTTNSNYYLYTGTSFWLLSPVSFGREGATNIGVLTYNYLSYGYLSYTSSFLSSYETVRPSISLKQGTEFLSGSTGEPDNPYAIITS